MDGASSPLLRHPGTDRSSTGGSNGIAAKDPGASNAVQPWTVFEDAPIKKNGLGPSTAIVQFASARFYAEEDEGFAVLDIIRLGEIDKPCSVKVATRGKSALGGVKYVEKSEVIKFDSGEMAKSFEVDLIDDDFFDTTLEFEVHLSNPEGCEIGFYLSQARVAIIDNDRFPSNAFAEEIDAGTEALQAVSVSLLTNYMWFAFWRVPTVWWKTILIGCLDQLKNVYYLMTIFLKVYLVDTVLNMKEDSPEHPLLVPGSRNATAMLLGVIWVAPNFVLFASDYCKVRFFEIGFFIRKHLRVNLFRKYLNYDDEARSEVQITEITTAMESDIPDLVSNGYTLLFELGQGLGKVVCVAAFMLVKDASSALPLLIYPSLMFFWIRGRRDQALTLEAESGEAQAQTLSMVVRLVRRIHMITAYGQREKVVDEFEGTIARQRELTKRVSMFTFFDGQLMSWITIMCMGLYIGLVSQAVLAGSLSLGTFLATINVYKDLGDRFDGVYQNITSLLSARDPLIGLVELLARSTDVGEKKAALDARRDNLQFAVGVNNDRSRTGDGRHGNPFDDLPFSLQSVNVSKVVALQDITVIANQGDFVLVTGSHGSGKGTLLDLLAGLRQPASGCVLTPAHLRVLPVMDTAEVSCDHNLLENLTFGAKEVSLSRVRTIARRVGIEGWLWEQLEAEINEKEREGRKRSSPSAGTASLADATRSNPNGSYSSAVKIAVADDVERGTAEEDLLGLQEEDPEVRGWDRRISRSQAHLIHLARCFIFNPDVLVLHRPVDHVDPELEDQLMKLFRDFVDNRGLNIEETVTTQLFRNRRPRTIFMSAGNAKGASVARYADRVWELQADGALEVMKRY